jgi:hypothetical protein
LRISLIIFLFLVVVLHIIKIIPLAWELNLKIAKSSEEHRNKNKDDKCSVHANIIIILSMHGGASEKMVGRKINVDESHLSCRRFSTDEMP